MPPSEADTTRSASATITRRARRRLLASGVSLVCMVALSYVVPGLEELRPAKPGDDYIPFWNVLGGPQDNEEEVLDELAGFEKLARTSEDTIEDVPVLIPEIVVADSSSEPAETGGLEVDALPAEKEPEELLFPTYAGHGDDTARVVRQIESPEFLEHFFGQLTLSELNVPGAITRAGQWGDSVLGGDGLTSVLRKKMQSRFGDSGHGFHVLSRYSVGYRHRGVRFDDDKWNSCEIIFKCRKDGRYGYGAVSSGSKGGARSRWRTTRKGPGQRVSRFEFWYQKKPKGGQFQVKVDGARVATLNTRSKTVQDARFTIEVSDGPHTFQVRAAGKGEARGYGVVLERDVPGVVWDELSLIGSFTQRLDFQKASHLAAQLEQRDIDLMVFMFGGNDVQREFQDLKRRMTPYEREYKRVITKFRKGRPRADCMVMSLIDHGKRRGKRVVTRPIVPRLVKSQRKVAKQMGCAFFDTYLAMGGKNSIGRWYRARPQLGAGDFSHPTAAGQRVIANLVYRALMKEYASFRQRNSGKPLPPLGGYKLLEARAVGAGSNSGSDSKKDSR